MGIERYGFTPDTNPDHQPKEGRIWPAVKRHAKRYGRKALIAGVLALELGQNGDKMQHPTEVAAVNQFYDDSQEVYQSRGNKILPPEEEQTKIDPQIFLRYVHDNESLTPELESQLEQDLTFLSQEFSPDIIWNLRHWNRVAKFKKKYIPAHPEVKGFEALGLDNKEVAKVFNPDFYPKGTVNGNVSKISYYDEIDEEFGQSVGLVHGKGAYPEAATGWLNDVTFYKEPNTVSGENRKDQITHLVSVFGHELGHANDWEHKVALKASERARFLADATREYNRQLVRAQDDPKSYEARVKYYSKITHSNPYLRKYLELSEWWADTAETSFNQYFWTPLGNLTTPAQEQDLVRSWYLREDKNFSSSTERLWGERWRSSDSLKDKLIKEGKMLDSPTIDMPVIEVPRRPVLKKKK